MSSALTREERGDRNFWLDSLVSIITPPLTALSEGRLHTSLPVAEGSEDRAAFACLEAFGRTLAGAAPWLAAPSPIEREEALRQRFLDLVRRGIAEAVDPGSPDYMNFSRGRQPLVDAAFLAEGILRAPSELYERLPADVRENLANALRMTRTILPHRSNWLLFSAMIEGALCRMGRDWDRMRVDYAVRQHMAWYKGDGVYGDGPEFHWDYYNSFVIQPMLVDLLDAVQEAEDEWAELKETVTRRAQRYAEILERMISPEGSYPPIGRSLAYRFGAFHLLAQAALRRELPAAVLPQQVRCALTAVIRRSLTFPGTFDPNGWLTIGFCGKQRSLGEPYISVGSLYLCTTVFLPLGLPPADPFWNGDADWTQKRLWNGGEGLRDHALLG